MNDIATVIDPLTAATLRELVSLVQTTGDIDLKDTREFFGNHFKSLLTEHLFPNEKNLVITLSTRLEDIDIKNTEDYFTSLAKITPELSEISSMFIQKANDDLPKDKIDIQIKLIKSKKLDSLHFIAQIFYLKKKEIDDAKAFTHELETTLNRTRKAYKTESDLKRLKEMEDKIANDYYNYYQHIKYLNVCERGMVCIVESYFTFAESILLGSEPSK